MVNKETADIFEKMSRVLAFKGANRFRALAYERAARSLRGLDADLTDLARRGKLEEIPGIGMSQARRGRVEARSVVNTWTWAKLSRWLEARRRRDLKAA